MVKAIKAVLEGGTTYQWLDEHVENWRDFFRDSNGVFKPP